MQEEVAAIAGIDVSTIKRYENNYVSHSLEICNKIAKAIKTDPTLLYDDYLAFIATNYGKKIRSARSKLGLTQEQLGNQIAIHRKTVSRWEKEILSPSREKFGLLNQIGVSWD